MSQDDVLDKALAWFDEGRRVAVATVVDTWGSSPRPRGSQLAVRDDGLFLGSVSGGCVEGKVVEAAMITMSDHAPRLLEFGVSNEEAWEVGLACGGTVRIFVEPVLVRDVLLQVRTAREKNHAIVLVTLLDATATSDAMLTRTWLAGDESLSPELRAAGERAIASDAAERVETSAGSVFVQAKNPPKKLVIVGAVHIAESLSKIALLLDYEITLIDPRSAFARKERWPGLNVLAEFPDEAMAKMKLDHRTAVVALSHDPKIDDPALESALSSPAFYIGALGSKKSHAARLARLCERGFSADLLERIHGPVGLWIGAKSPTEIAVSIVAQMTHELRGA